MIERAYTVAEIDRMRDAVNHMWLWGRKVNDERASVIDGENTDAIVSGTTVSVTSTKVSRSYTQEEKTKCVEELLRTYMLAGIGYKELWGGE